MVLETAQRRTMEKPALNNDLLSLILSKGNVHKAWKQVKANHGGPGIDGITLESFLSEIGPRWDKIRRALMQGYYVPAPVKRVEIPKKTGGTRKLGVPTVLDRVIQQAMAQVLSTIFDPGFSQGSFGFRPNRSAHGAIKRVHEYVKQGYRWAVDVDLEKFFDTVDHDTLIHYVGLKVRDKSVLKLIGRYLRAGTIDKVGKKIPSPIGTPQGGPLSPLLSNILLHELDLELERRQAHFARYADDFVIVTKTQAEGEVVLGEITEFLDKRLHLRVNRTKSKVVPIQECQFLGFTFKDKKICWSRQAFLDFQTKVKKLTGRSWGVSMKHRLIQLKLFVNGWVNYFGISQFYSPIPGIDNWIRRRIRMCYWKQWRYVRTRIQKLLELGVPKHLAVPAGSSSKSYWRSSKTYAINLGMSNKWLDLQGVPNVKSLWCKAQGYT